MEADNQSLAPLLIHEEKPIAPSGIRGIWFFLKLVSWWFAYSAMMGPLPSVIFPAQIEAIVGSNNKEKFNGFVPAFGAVISLLITPIAGIMSDRWGNSRIGRRKVFVIIGSIISLVFLLLCSTATQYKNIWAFVGFTMGLQFGTNFAAGPYAGLIPDNIHPSQVGRASGYTGLAAAMGYLVGLVSAGLLVRSFSLWHEYLFLGIVFLVFCLPTIFGFKELPNYDLHEPLTVKGFFLSFYLDPRHYKPFYWVIITRFLEQMGYYTVLPFMQYFIQDVVFSGEPKDGNDHEFFSSLFMSSVVMVSVPSSIIAGLLSDKYGRKRLVMISTGIMMAGVGSMVIVCYIQKIGILFGSGVIFGVGYGAFLAVDWALALDSLPEGCDAAKDMGIWHMAFVLPQMIAPVIAGQILSKVKVHSFELGYAIVFAVSCAWFLLATICVVPIKLRVRTGEPSFRE